MGIVSQAGRLLSQRIVTVKVDETKPGGIRVTLEDGRKGFISPREIAWERRISIPPVLPKRGAVMEVVILQEETAGGLLSLSIRHRRDPWAEAMAEQKYKVKQIVTGEVVNVRNTGVYVQVEPGVDGVLVPRDVPLRNDQNIPDVLWLGDKVNATITGIDTENRLLELNLIQRLQQLPVRDEHQRKDHLLEYFGAEKHPRLFLPVGEKTEAGQKTSKAFIRPSLRKLERVLLVDDEFDWLDLLSEGLERQLKVPVDVVGTGQEAFDNIRSGIDYSLIAIDFHLKDELGTALADEIRKTDSKTPIVILSALDLDDGRNPIQGYPFCYKNVEDLIQIIDELRSGYWHVSRTSSGDDGFIRQLGMQALAKRTPSEIFGDILAWLHGQTGVTQCLLVELDHARQTGIILASHPVLEPAKLQRAQDGLYFSPARQVVEEEREFCDNTVDLDEDRKYKNFLRSLYFESCLGIPVRVSDQATRHALFLLDEEPQCFLAKEEAGDKRILHARTASYFLAVAIERINLLELMRQYEEKYTLGQLAAVMIHEINNQMGPLEETVADLKKHQASRPPQTQQGLIQAWVEKMDQEIDKLARLQGTLNTMVKSYSRQAAGKLEPVDVNEVAADVKRELDRIARKRDTLIVLDLAEGLPQARAIRSQLQQIVLNVTLNAVQMINIQNDWASLIGRNKSYAIPALQTGMVIIQTRYGAEAAAPIEIRIIDNGPGVHWRDQDGIFHAGVTRRGGAGLGLYISRNLVERMGGRLSVFDSILFLGSAFLLELLSFDTLEAGQ